MKQGKVNQIAEVKNAVNATLKSRMRESRKYGSVGGIIAMISTRLVSIDVFDDYGKAGSQCRALG
jgi:hypothetical protein